MSLLHRHKGDHDQLNLTEIASGQTSGPPAPSRAPRRRSSGLKFFASAAIPKAEPGQASHKAWEANYLKDLRANRPARPGGSRPLPDRASTSTPELYSRAASALSFRPSGSTRQPEPYDRSVSALSRKRAQSEMPTLNTHPELNNANGQSPIPQPAAGVASRDFSTSTTSTKRSSIMPSGTYRESGMRWMEKQEARSLREALEDMDMRGDAKIHAAAQDEASELVLKHRHSGMPSKSPYQPCNYKAHLEKGAHARSQSVGWYAGQGATTNGHMSGQRSTSDGSNSSKHDSNKSPVSQATSNTSMDPSKSNNGTQAAGEQGHALWDSPHKKAYMSLTFAESPTKKSTRRRSSGARARHVSGGLFRNPDDKIYEEPDSAKKEAGHVRSDVSRIPAPLGTKTRNTAPDSSTSRQPACHPRLGSGEEKQRVYRSEIHRNPPSQSRDPSYKKNGLSPTPPTTAIANEGEVDEDRPATRDGREIRSDDIRAATSKRMRDRSPKLPSPTVVSDRLGRPIVSFDQDWKPKDADKQEDSSSGRPSGVPGRLRFKPHMPESTASAPIVPTINVPNPLSIPVNETPADDTPTIPFISVSEAPIPTISLPDDIPPARALPTPSNRSRPSPAKRPLPHHSSTTPVHSSKLHWTPSSRRATAQCAACALPIEGRIVSASSQRFHPHCFTCHHCATALECVAFYPEPDTSRTVRLARIEARAASSYTYITEEKPGETALDDGDASLRFYCHLDYHELFSPRCRSCKTPIETEVVLACGGSWHVGHFFCAECGDPFDAKTPFVEKDGYAWCVGCHAGRFSGKCSGCRRPVVEGGITALGGEWHEGCFCCVVSPRLPYWGESNG
jgi:paxillin